MAFVHPSRFHLYSFHLVGFHADRVSNKLYKEKVLYLVIKKVLYFFSFFHSRNLYLTEFQKSCITVWTLESVFYLVAFGNLTKSMTVESS